jgi:flagellar assembly protein FliH
LLRETRRRVSTLAALERDLEDRIRARWEEGEAEARRRLARAEEEISTSRKRAEGDAKEAKVRAEKEGRAAGFREGFGRGREEGYRLGLEEGRRDGQRDGQREGREEGARRIHEELSGAASALADAARLLREEQESLLAGARKDLLFLALEIAKKIVKREIHGVGDVALQSVVKAIDLIFRRGALLIQVNPEDAPGVEQALRSAPRWGEGFESIEVRAQADVTRGGCRLVSGAGTVDMTVETQLSLIEAALQSAEESPGSASAPESQPHRAEGDGT